MAPELLNPENPAGENNLLVGASAGGPNKISRPTKESDVYALAMVMIEVLSGRAPFDQHRDTVVIFKVLSGNRPERPTSTEVSDDVWKLIQNCWFKDPMQRSKLEGVIESLNRAINSAELGQVVNYTPLALVI